MDRVIIACIALVCLIIGGALGFTMGYVLFLQKTSANAEMTRKAQIWIFVASSEGAGAWTANYSSDVIDDSLPPLTYNQSGQGITYINLTRPNDRVGRWKIRVSVAAVDADQCFFVEVGILKWGHTPSALVKEYYPGASKVEIHYFFDN